MKQARPRQWLGAFLTMYTSASVVLTPFTYLGIATTVWNTGGRSFIIQYLSWFNFPMFLGLAILCGIGIMFVYYKFIYSSQVSFVSHQSWEHDNPVRLFLEAEAAKEEDRHLQLLLLLASVIHGNFDTE